MEMDKISDKKLHALSGNIREGTLTSLMDQLEINLSKLEKGTGKSALEYLRQFDEIYANIVDLNEKGHPPRTELPQFEFLGETLKKKAGTFLHTIGGVKALQAARQERQTKPEAWWWYLDEWVARRNKAAITRTAIWLVTAAVILTILVVIYNRFFAPSPATLARLDHQDNAIKDYTSGDLSTALTEAQQAVDLAPNDTELLALKGAIQKKMGLSDDANQTFAEAEKNAGSRVNFLVYRAFIYANLNEPEAMLADAQEAINIDPKSAEGWMYFGQAKEALGDKITALDAYQKASDLASAQGKDALTATIRIKLAMLEQSMGNSPDLTPTPEMTLTP